MGRKGGRRGDGLAEEEVREDFVHVTVSRAWEGPILSDQSAVELLSFDGHFCLGSIIARMIVWLSDCVVGRLLCTRVYGRMDRWSYTSRTERTL